MRLNPRLLKDTLTAYGVTAGAEDPLTGAGSAMVAQLWSQPCSLQEVRRIPDPTLSSQSGSQGVEHVWKCYTAWRDLTGVKLWRVNGVAYGVLRSIDVGGQREVLELQFGPAGQV